MYVTSFPERGNRDVTSEHTDELGSRLRAQSPSSVNLSVNAGN